SHHRSLLYRRSFCFCSLFMDTTLSNSSSEDGFELVDSSSSSSSRISSVDMASLQSAIVDIEATEKTSETAVNKMEKLDEVKDWKLFNRVRDGLMNDQSVDKAHIPVQELSEIQRRYIEMGIRNEEMGTILIEKNQWDEKETKLKQRIKQLEKAARKDAAKAAVDAATAKSAAAASAAEATIPQQIVLATPPPSINEATSHTFRLRMTGISRLRDNKEVILKSDKVRFAGVEWTINLRSGDVVEKCKTRRYLGVFVAAVTDPLPEGWNCVVRSSCTFYSQYMKNVRTEPILFHSNFRKGYVCWGDNIIKIKELFNPSNGYVTDDAILVSVEVEVFPTQG
ncbi:hypothetical protein PFISCL1PPCAC_9463, partial [Pristionchus fissidentatus]